MEQRRNGVMGSLRFFILPANSFPPVTFFRYLSSTCLSFAASADVLNGFCRKSACPVSMP